MRGAVAEILGHHTGTAGHNIAAADLTDAAALAAVVNGVVAAAARETDADAAAADENIAVGIEAVRIPGGLVDNRNGAAADMNPAFRVCLALAGVRVLAEHAGRAEAEAAAAVCVHAVVGGIDFDLAAGNVDGQRLDALIA